MSSKDKDLGFKEIVTNFKKLSGVTIKIGIQADAGSNQVTGEKVVDYAYLNEFGTNKIPQRSFIRSTFDEQNKNWYKAAADINITGNILADLKKIGVQATNDITKKIDTTYYPPNSPFTIAKKGSSKPLIDTGQMRASVKYVIEGLL